ncbi:hypothetical protein ZIOFF_054910 [Zingiber officinale]|uniref:Uncharacterized protein n=1 Tax=Zingiber officinale TaxID=94328 RepID=A0A8J5FGN0_ZINOF|nr:hypothetical protein ZIOFF_054910 [Zingiber officinale]
MRLTPGAIKGWIFVSVRETARILPRPQDFILKFPLEEIHSTDELSYDLASLFDRLSGADLSRNRSQFRPTAMDAKIREFFDAAGDSIPWCERDVIACAVYARDVRKRSQRAAVKNESLLGS